MESHANQLRKREEMLVERESEVQTLRAQLENQIIQFEKSIRSKED